MNWFIFFISNMFFIAIFSVVYFFVREVIRIQNGKLTEKQLLISGIIIGLTLLFIQLIAPIKVDGILINITIIYLLIIPIFLGNKIFLRSLPIAFLGLLLTFDEYTLIVLPRIFEFILLSAFSIGIASIKKLKTDDIKILFSSLFFVAITLLTNFLENIMDEEAITKLSFWIPFVIASLWYSLFLIIQFVTIKVLEKIYQNFEKLETFSTTDSSNYYRISLAKSMLREEINRFGIKKGIYIIFDIPIDIQNNKDQMDIVLHQLKKEISRIYIRSQFIKVNYSYYGAFIPIFKDIKLGRIFAGNYLQKREEDDFLFELSRILSSIIINGKEIKAGASIYGIQSFDFVKLEEEAIFALTQARNIKNNLSVFNFQKIRSFLLQRASVVGLSDYTTGYKIDLVKSLNEEDRVIYPVISFKDNQKTLKKIYQSVEVDSRETLERFYANKTLLAASETNILFRHILIPYSISYMLSREFVIQEFINKIKTLVNPNKVIIGIDINSISKFDETMVALDLLRKRNIKFSLLNVEIEDFDLVEKIRPDFIKTSHNLSLKQLFITKYRKNKESISNFYEANNYHIID